MFVSEPVRARMLAKPAFGPAATVPSDAAVDLGADGLRRRLQARELVQRATRLLMEWDDLSEPDAHRGIQRASMDTRIPMVAVARALLIAGEVRRRTPRP
jgi:AmiR/NasT family two-component response regulator